MVRSVVQSQATAGDRISQLPVEILDHILGFLPIQEAAKTAVLSKVWRDVWFTLTRLCFDDYFFRYFRPKYEWVSEYLKESLCFHVISKVLSEHKGSIQKFVCCDSTVGILTVVRSRSLDMDQWLLLVTQRGVEEINLCIWGNKYKLPDCIFSCSTLRRLDLYGISIEPPNSPCAFPNVTSLSFECGYFSSRNPSGYVADAPKLENLSFVYCEDMFLFNINARNVCTLTVKCSDSSKSDKFLPENLDLRSICTLEMDNDTLQNLLGQYTTNELALQLPPLNVELLKLSGFGFQDNARTSAFVCLLCRCPKLCNLEINFVYGRTGDVNTCIDATSGVLKNLRSVVRRHKMLLSLKLRSFQGRRPQMHFIKEMLACLPAVEEVVIICLPGKFDWNKEHDISEEILHFPCASPKAKIAYK